MISVIVPVYNAEKYLKRCVQSVLAQTYQDLEIILVNDGSRDNSLALCRCFEAENSNVCVIDKKNEGAGAARNAGLKIAKGEYIYFIDSDDWIDKDMLECMLSVLKEFGDDSIGICAHYAENDDGSGRVLWPVCPKEESWNENDVPDCIAKMDMASVFNYLWDRLYSKRIIDEKKIYFDNKFTTGGDLDFNAKYFRNVKKCVKIDRPMYHYIKDGTDSLCARYKKNLYNIVTGLCDCREALYQALGMLENENYRRVMEKKYIGYYMVLVPNMFRINSQLRRIDRVRQFEELMQNSTLIEYLQRNSAETKLEKLFYSAILGGNAERAERKYSVLFFIRNHFESIYRFVRRFTA